jgi:hypothetical protein
MVAVTGQMVVLTATVTVVTTGWSVLAGQLVISGAQLVMVWTVVVKTVEVLW